MRRKDREIKDFDSIISILENCKVIHLAMISDGKPYSVPINFGYIINESNGTKKLSLYFHGAGEGKKISALKENSEVCFSCERNVETKSYNNSDVPCTWTCFYESVVGFGKVTILEKSPEKIAGLDALMKHNGYKIPNGVKTIAYNMMELANTMVAKIEVTEITGKTHLKK